MSKLTQFFVASGVLAVVAVSTLAGYMVSGKSTTSHDTGAPGYVASAGASQGTYPTSGLTVAQVIAQQIKGDTRTQLVHSVKVIQGGQAILLNNEHYKDAGNLPTYFKGNLPGGSPAESLIGKTIISKGRLSSYKDTKQWAAFAIEEVK